MYAQISCSPIPLGFSARASFTECRRPIQSRFRAVAPADASEFAVPTEAVNPCAFWANSPFRDDAKASIFSMARISSRCFAFAASSSALAISFILAVSICMVESIPAGIPDGQRGGDPKIMGGGAEEVREEGRACVGTPTTTRHVARRFFGIYARLSHQSWVVMHRRMSGN